MYDSLNRHFLPNYGGDLAKMPNFKRLGEKTVTFDNCYVGSLPCMPARRELHTGRLNFLHRGWSPLEPFDDSMPQILKENGIYSHIISDHQHYWEDGGATYHNRYTSWEIVRGQEGDPWKGDLRPVENTNTFGLGLKPPFLQNILRQDMINRSHMKEENDFPQAQVFNNGLDFMETNKDADNWFLQMETFDPHEPFFTPDEYQALYRDQNEEPFAYDWPPYGPLVEDDAFITNVRKKYLALLSMCDTYMGKFLDKMDELDLWKDTMVVVNTDHGYLLGEHLWWSKSVMPIYNEIAHTPFFIWDPRSGVKGERRQALVQTIDIAPTILDYFGLPLTKDMQGKPLGETVKNDTKVRDYALFGFFGSHINITDGRYLYMRAPLSKENTPLYDYTLMPNHMRVRMSPDELSDLQLQEPFPFTKGVRTLKIKSAGMGNNLLPHYRYGNKLYDLDADPGQENPLDNPEKELELIREMAKLMQENQSPDEQYQRVGIPKNGEMTISELQEQRAARQSAEAPKCLQNLRWDRDAVWQFDLLVSITHAMDINTTERFATFMDGKQTVDKDNVYAFARTVIPKEHWHAAHYTMEMVSRLG